jgi:hypothetical protein
MEASLFLGEGGRKGDSSIKGLVVRILCDEWPLSVREMHERIKRTHGIGCSYQAVFKQVKELLENNVVLSEGRYYKINREWLARMNARIESLLEFQEMHPEGILGPRGLNPYF